MSGAFAGGAALGLSEGIRTGRERRDEREARQFQQDIQEQQLDLQRRQFKLRQDDAKLKLDTAKKTREATDRFFGFFTGQPNASGGASQPSSGRSLQTSAPSVATPGFVSEPEGRAAGARAAELNPVPEQPRLGGGTEDITPQDAMRVRQFRTDFTDPQQFGQLQMLAARSGHQDTLDRMIQSGVVKPPPNHDLAIERSIKMQNLNMKKEEFEREKKERKALANMYVSSGTERGAAAAVMLASGDPVRAAEIFFPNIEEPTTMWQSFLKQAGGDPIKAANNMNAANQRPTTATLALRAANGDKKAADALQILGETQSQAFTVDKNGNITYMKGAGSAGIGGAAVQNRAIQKIESINTTNKMIDNFFLELDASGGRGVGPEALQRHFTQVASDALITARGIAAGDEFTQKLIDNFNTGDVTKLETMHDILAAKIGNDLLADGGVLTEPDFQKAKQMIGGDTKSLLANPARYRAALEAVKITLQARAEGAATLISDGDKQRLMQRAKAQLPQQQPQNSAPAAQQAGTQSVPSQQAQPQQAQQPVDITQLPVDQLTPEQMQAELQRLEGP